MIFLLGIFLAHIAVVDFCLQIRYDYYRLRCTANQPREKNDQSTYFIETIEVTLLFKNKLVLKEKK